MILLDFKYLFKCDTDFNDCEFDQLEKQLRKAINDGCDFILFRLNSSEQIFPSKDYLKKLYILFSDLPAVKIAACEDFANVSPELMFMFDIRLGMKEYKWCDSICTEDFVYNFKDRTDLLFGELSSEISVRSDILVRTPFGENETNFDEFLEKYFKKIIGEKSREQLDAIKKCMSHIKSADFNETDLFMEESLCFAKLIIKNNEI